jgi:2-keto-4-pentenoate hydratase/2-oxohepta-3-ene-1,7-dioic acid hydratase in catechol pathway
MTRWIRFEHEGRAQFGTLEADTIHVHEGDLFAGSRDTGRTLALAQARLLTPCEPTKMVALWNNFRALAAKLGQSIPDEPLWFLKANSSFHPGGEPIRVPASYAGKVVYEAELGVVIGRRARNVPEEDAARHIFGYTCVNDVTAAELLKKDPSFDQWSRAKGFDTFGVFGPVIATGLDPLALTIRLSLNGQERQNYPVADMVFPPARLVAMISRDLTLEPGDVIACGTSVGVGSMKPGSEVVVSIEGIGELANRYG